jgi:chemotaxis protein MotA
MFQIIAIVILFVMVFGGYVISGGHFEVILEALPHEMMTIGGAAIAALLLGNAIGDVKRTAGDIAKAFSGPKWKQADYRDLLCLLFLLTKTMKMKGMIALEAHIEKPSESAIFKRYSKIGKDHFVLDFICDTLRMMTMSLEDPHQVEAAMEKQLEKHHHEALVPATALQTMADGLPALGIVAAVLGVIKVMAHISEPASILGELIGGALTGTLMGVLFSYGFVGPMANFLKGESEAEIKYLQCMKAGVLAHMQGYAPAVSVEFARKALLSDVRPTFYEVEQTVSALPPV